MATTTNNGWVTPDNTAYVKDGASAIRSLGQSIDTSVGTGLLAWTAYTPTTTGITLGNGTLTAKFSTLGKRVEGFVRIALGSTSVITGGFSFTLPSTVATGCMPLMSALFEDTGAAAYGAIPYFDAAQAKAFVFALNTVGTYALGTTTSATIPFTWTNGDFINLSFSYQAA
jgi:hypothetical protein